MIRVAVDFENNGTRMYGLLEHIQSLVNNDGLANSH